MSNQPPPASGVTRSNDIIIQSNETTDVQKASFSSAPTQNDEKINELEKRAYTLTYSNKNKGPELGHATVKGQLFQNNRPVSYFEAQTNEDGKFAFNQDYGKDVSINLHYISGQEKLRMECEGLAKPGSKEIMITCHKI